MPEKIRRRDVLASPIGVLFVRLSSGQTASASETGYIEQVFRDQIGELPRMGWFTDENFVAETEAREIVIYGPIGSPSAARRKGALDKQSLKLMRIRGLACESDGTRLAVFPTGEEARYERALYTTKKFPGAIRSGLITVQLTRADLIAVDRLLGWPARGSIRRDEAIGVEAGAPYFSFHRLYKNQSGLLAEEALLLHADDGKILAHKLLKDLDKDQPCDGCAIPNFVEGGATYIPLNIFVLPGFRYPLLLLNSNTVEGRALTFATFTPTGQLDSLDTYEYVVTCGENDPPSVH